MEDLHQSELRGLLADPAMQWVLREVVRRHPASALKQAQTWEAVLRAQGAQAVVDFLLEELPRIARGPGRANG